MKVHQASQPGDIMEMLVLRSALSKLSTSGKWAMVMFGIKPSNFFWGYGAIEPYPQYGRVCANVTHWPI